MIYVSGIQIQITNYKSGRMADLLDYYSKIVFGTIYEYTTQYQINHSKVIEGKNPASANYVEISKTRMVIDPSRYSPGYTSFKYEPYTVQKFDSFNYEKVYNIEALTNDLVICIQTNCKNHADAESLQRILPSVLDIRTRWCIFHTFKFLSCRLTTYQPRSELLRERYDVCITGESTNYCIKVYLVMLYALGIVCIFIQIAVF